MARITVEDCLEKQPNRFALVILAARRAKQILAGSESSCDEGRENKPIVCALREVAQGSVHFMTDEDIAEERERELLAQEAILEAEKARRAATSLFKESDDSSNASSQEDAEAEKPSALPAESENGAGVS